MAHSLPVLHQALADVIASVTGLRVYPRPKANASPPAAMIQLAELETVVMGRGTDQLNFEVLVLTGDQVETGYDRLVEFADPTGDKSIRAAIWQNRTLGLSGTDAAVSGFRLLNLQEIDAYRAYGGIFTVTVLTRGS